MALDERGEGLAEALGVERAGELELQRDVVGRGFGAQLVKEEKPALAGREQAGAVRQAGQGRRRCERGPALGGRIGGQAGDYAGQLAQRGRPEQLAQRQLDRPAVAQPRHQAGGEQRMAAELEEVVVEPGRLGEAKQLLEDRRQLLSSGVAGRPPGVLFLEPGRQGAAVDFAGAGARQLAEQDEDARHLVFRQAVQAKAAQLAGFEAGLAGYVGDQDRLAVAAGEAEHGGFAHRRMAGEQGFDLAAARCGSRGS